MQQDDALDALGGGLQDVAEREYPGVVHQYVDGGSFAPHGLPQLRSGFDARQVDLHDPHLGPEPGGGGCRFPDAAVRTRSGGEYFAAYRLQRFAAVARQHQVVAQRRQPQGVTASDARPGSRDQRPGASRGDGSPPADAAAASGNGCGRGAALPARCDCFAFHHGRRLSSSTIRRGRLSQCLQHFMSTEYIRAMQ